MRSPQTVLETLRKHAQEPQYQYERLYRNLYNPQLYLLAYQNLYANKGSMTAGTDGQTISGMSMKRIEALIQKLRDHSYQPHPARRQYIPKKSGNGLRPLGIPAADDKLVQEVIRMILESIYEPTFQNTSHGFRPNRSCHTALSQIQKTFTGVTWFVEGDIKGCFDNIDHHILVNILRCRIKDEVFIDLIWKLLRAGYLEDWMKHQTYSGTPQGSGVSPLLANIYMNELDQFMEQYQVRFNKGDKRRFSNAYVNANHHYARARERYAKKWDTMSDEERRQARITQKELQAVLLSTPSRDQMDPNYRRILYVRYADDFLIGIIGSRSDAEQVKADVSHFLKQELHLTMSPEKTLITHGHDKARFLGYDITISKDQIAKQTKGGKKRSYNGRVVLLLPKEKWMGKLQEYGALQIRKDSSGKEMWMPVARNGLQNKEPIEILTQYNGEIRGIYNYYRMARNVSVLNKFRYVMEYSMYKTLAVKMRCSAAKIKRKYTKDRIFGIEYETKHGLKRAEFYHDGFRKSVPAKADMDTQPDYKITVRPKEVIARFMTGYCELCCKNERPVLIHQVKRLKDLSGNELWEQFMLRKHRKTLIVCEDCYKTINKS